MDATTNVNVNEDVVVEGGVTPTNDNVVQEEKTFTQEDLDKIMAKKFAQWERKAEQRANDKAKEVEEAEKLKRMSETERQQAEMKKQLEEYNKMKSEMAREKLSNQVVKELASRNL
ncbi:capsid assembly scaffolding protein Gp46 family protein, partial [Clostridium sp.]|uniref:capsid assembly scaffolding protein Gp46 family protein n=1 Tax=Clostridium sp. TaxID=1506 RepID=UPI003F327DAE